MIGFQLGKSMSQCPKYWDNFIRYLQKGFYTRDVAMPVIQQELKKYGARYRLAGSEPNDYIEFADEEHLMVFVLRWS